MTMQQRYLVSALILLCFIPVKAIILENLVQNGDLHELLSNKKVGYFLGSFDPLHKGHEDVAHLSLGKRLCDFVIIYPAWGGDGYKNRVDVLIRLEMLFAVFKDHPQVIVTRLAPKELQDILTIPDALKAGFVKPAFNDMSFIGIIGSDVALDIHAGAPGASTYMIGLQVAPEHAEHTFGCCILFPVESFIVAQRMGDILDGLQGAIGNRVLAGIIQSSEQKAVSSTEIKKALKQGGSIDSMVSEPVRAAIETHGLYRPARSLQY